MRCPKCKYEPTMAEQISNKEECPKCGIFYEKYRAQQKENFSVKTQVVADKPSVQTMAGQPVVVVGIQMRFWSMVVFMVKWAFAAIPALIIIGLIVTAITIFSTGFITGFGSSSKVSNFPVSSGSSLESRVEAKEEPIDSPPVRAELISAVLVDKGFYDENYETQNTLKISFENKTGREIRAFEGVVILSDLLGNVIKRVKLSDSAPAWVGDKLLWSGSIRYNQFIQEDQELKDASVDSLKMNFELNKILYKDGELQEF